MSRLGPYELGPGGENEGIYTGDARELAQAIPDESVDLIFCDPIYQRIDDYRWLAEAAVRVLKPDSACLAWCSKVTLPECQIAMSASLTYQSTLFYAVRCKQARPIFSYGLIPWTTPCLVFAKGQFKCQPFIPDTYITSRPSQNSFKWQKNTGVLEYWLNAFSRSGSLIVDFFCGSGSLPAACKARNRRYVAFEIEPDIADLARDRVRKTQPPLPGLTLEAQTALELERQ